MKKPLVFRNIWELKRRKIDGEWYVSLEALKEWAGEIVIESSLPYDPYVSKVPQARPDVDQMLVTFLVCRLGLDRFRLKSPPEKRRRRLGEHHPVHKTLFKGVGGAEEPDEIPPQVEQAAKDLQSYLNVSPCEGFFRHPEGIAEHNAAWNGYMLVEYSREHSVWSFGRWLIYIPRTPEAEVRVMIASQFLRTYIKRLWKKRFLEWERIVYGDGSEAGQGVAGEERR